MMKVCVVIPAFNEAKTIGELIRQVHKFNPDVVIVDDGSCDGTSGIAEENKAIVLRNERNMGKGASLIRGYAYVLREGFEAVISMDGDGQHSPEDLPVFIREAENSDCGVIVGNRMSSLAAMPWIRVKTNQVMSKFISWVTKQEIPDTQCGFRLIKKEVLEKLALSTSRFEIESEVLVKASRLGFKIKSINIRTIYGAEKSQINPLIDTLRFLRFAALELWKKR